MVLVVDYTALRAISSSIGMYDLMEHRVSIVEDLTRVRAPFRDMAVLYVVEPSARSVRCIVDDWTPPPPTQTKKSTTTTTTTTNKGGPLYGNTIFLYFLGHLPNALFAQIKGCKQLASRIKILKEINLHFLTKEGMAFHFDNMNGSGNDGGGGGGGGASSGVKSSTMTVGSSIYTELYLTNSSPSATTTSITISPLRENMAARLVTVCATLNEYPHVRYKEGSSSSTKQLAHLFQRRMNEFVGCNSIWWYNGDGLHPNTDRATLLLLDRSVDCLSPLIHEFTYEAMVYDLLPNIDTDGRITYDNVMNDKDKGGGGGGGGTTTASTKMDALLNDNDEIWKELRGKHIADVIQILSTKIRDIVNSSSVAPVIGGKKGSDSTGGGGGALSIDQMAKALKALPEYREIMSKLSQHMQIAHQCMDAFNKQGLLDLSDVEQTLATGKSDVGRIPKLKEMLGRVVEQFRTAGGGNNASAMRLRLLAIVIISQHGIAVDDLQKLLKEANLSCDELRTFHNLEKLSCPLVRAEDDASSVRKRGKLVAKVKREGPGRLRPYHDSAERGGGGGETDSEYSSSRYVCLLKSIMEDAAQGKLSVEDYPSVLPLPDAESMLAPTAKSISKSVRKPSMNVFAASTATQSTNAGKKKVASGGRQIVFMVGGMCYSELRSAREVMNTTGTDIVIGSTRCITPKDFLDDLNSLG